MTALPASHPGGAADAGDIAAELRRAPLFAQLDDDQLAKLAAVARPLHMDAEQGIFLQGDAASAFYLLADGGVKVYKLFRDGRTATLRHVQPGETFGESVLFHEVYPSSTQTMVASRLYRFDTRQFLALLLAEPQLAVNLLGAMARLMLLLNRRVEELLLPVPARLARYLLALADEQLEPPTPSTTHRVVKLPTTKRELAARLGTVPETLSRTFDRLKRAGVLRMSSGHELIEILDFAALQRLAQE
jgi:CRP/FNR family transcriptional regulator, dissimilatory nitrate respiration regulator